MPKQSHQTKSQEFPEHFHSFTDIIFQFKFRLWLSDLLNRAIDSDIKVLNREGDRLNYHPLPCDRLNWHTLLNQWEDRKFTWNIILKNITLFLIRSSLCAWYMYIHFCITMISSLFVRNFGIFIFISISDIVSINERTLILKIISQCDVKDTENYQSVWCQRYWKLSVSVTSKILKIISQCDVKDTENYLSVWCQRYWKLSVSVMSKILKTICQCDVKDTENYQSVWHQRYWKLSVSVTSKILKIISQCDIKDIENYQSVWHQRYWKLSVSVTSKILKIISQCDVKDTENYQSVWHQRYWKLSVSVTSKVLKIISQCDVKDTENCVTSNTLWLHR